jgi:hypothetical protein
MKTLAFVLGLAVLAVALPSGAPSAEEYVVHIFKCPPQTTVKFNWKNKIDTQPTDFPVVPDFDNVTHYAQFKESAVNLGANTVQCLYHMTGNYQVPYLYKVHRKIIYCEGVPSANISCRLKKD